MTEEDSERPVPPETLDELLAMLRSELDLERVGTATAHTGAAIVFGVRGPVAFVVEVFERVEDRELDVASRPVSRADWTTITDDPYPTDLPPEAP